MEMSNKELKQFKQIGNALGRFHVIVEKIIKGFGILFKSQYAKDLAAFLRNNAHVILKAVLEASIQGQGKHEQERKDIAFGIIGDTLPDMKASASWINFGIELFVIILKAMAKK